MKPEIYQALFYSDRNYWWSQARHELTMKLCRERMTLNSRKPPHILDVGCCTGALLEQLRKVGAAVGIDRSELALAHCRRAGLTSVVVSEGNSLPFAEAGFDMVTALDVVEHIADDASAVAELARVLKPDGFAVIMVPAFAFLWTSRDLNLGHYRRYRKTQLNELVKRAGLQIILSSYTNPSLFIALCASKLARAFVRNAPVVPTGVAGVPTALNAVLRQFVRFENLVAITLGWPFGTSLLTVARKPAATPRDGRRDDPS